MCCAACEVESTSSQRGLEGSCYQTLAGWAVTDTFDNHLAFLQEETLRGRGLHTLSSQHVCAKTDGLFVDSVHVLLHDRIQRRNEDLAFYFTKPQQEAHPQTG